MKNYFQFCSRLGKRKNPKVPEIRFYDKFLSRTLEKMSENTNEIFNCI